MGKWGPMSVSMYRDAKTGVYVLQWGGRTGRQFLWTGKRDYQAALLLRKRKEKDLALQETGELERRIAEAVAARFERAIESVVEAKVQEALAARARTLAATGGRPLPELPISDGIHKCKLIPGGCRTSRRPRAGGAPRFVAARDIRLRELSGSAVVGRGEDGGRKTTAYPNDRSSFPLREALSPVIGLAMKMHHGKDPDLAGICGIENSVGKATDQASPDLFLDGRPSGGISQYVLDGRFHLKRKVEAEPALSLFVVGDGSFELRLCVGMEG